MDCLAAMDDPELPLNNLWDYESLANITEIL
jgi:hypothetical protein